MGNRRPSSETVVRTAQRLACPVPERAPARPDGAPGWAITLVLDAGCAGVQRGRRQALG